MALSLTRWPQMSTAEKLADCSEVTTTRALAHSAAPAPTTVTFTIRCGPYLRGEQAAVPAAEAAALVAAGFAT